MKSLKDDGRRDIEAKGKVALGFDKDDVDYEILVSRGVAHGKEYVIYSSCSFHKCCERRNLLRLVCDEDIVNLPNNERVKVVGTGEVVVMTHDRVKWRLGNEMYMSKFKRNLIPFGRLEGKECSFKELEQLVCSTSW